MVAPLFGLTICRMGKRCFLNVVFLGSVIPGPNPHCVGITPLSRPNKETHSTLPNKETRSTLPNIAIRSSLPIPSTRKVATPGRTKSVTPSNAR